MRLIDADELLKNWGQTFFAMGGDRLGTNGEEIMFYLNGLIREIKNAPTVELCYQTTSCLDCKMYDNENHNCPRFCEVIRSAVEEIDNKQGEWVYREEWFEDEEKPRMTWGCNLCGHSIKSIHEKLNFCPNCGADMRGKENE